MLQHKHRVLLICALAAVSLVATVVAAAFGASAEVLGALGTADTLLVPAAIDAIAVERRRRTPGVKAVSDDVN